MHDSNIENQRIGVVGRKMITIMIALKDIIIDAEHEIDLSLLPTEEAINLIKKSYNFLSTMIDVSINHGIATISLPENKSQQTDKGLSLFQEGVKEAEKGKYQRAIQLFRKTLNTLPNHTEARRNLAMAFLESGHPEEAKNHLIEVLRLNPNDKWSYLLMGNIFAKHEDNFHIAEKFYLKAYELDPKDSYLLSNYAALMMDRKKYKDAQNLFSEALSINPRYPNTYFGLALSFYQEGRNEMALITLEDMFIKASFEDPRSLPVVEQARELYRETNTKVAEKNLEVMMGFVDDRRKNLENGNYPIKLIEDNTLEYVTARTQMAWKHNREHHEISYRKKNPVTLPHILAHEMEHINLENHARQTGRNRIFMTTPEIRERSIRSIGDHIYKLKDLGYSEETITKVMLDIVNGLANQLFNCPLDMIIERRIHDNYEILRPSQFLSLFNFQDENLKVLTNKEIKKLTPPRFIGQTFR